VTHEDLFFERAVKLPFFNVELPLLAFFFLAPILFIIVHAYTLVHLVFLTEKAKRFDEAVRRQSGGDDGLRERLPSNIFIQFLAGPSSLRRGPFGWLLRAIGWVTLVIAPILLLLMMQVQFLPFHSSFITWTQRLALVVDLALIWWLWGKILAGREIEGGRRASWAWAGLGGALTLAAMLFSGTVVTFPGEWQEDYWPEWRLLPALSEWANPGTEKDASGNLRVASFQDWFINAERLSLHDWLFNEYLDLISRRRFPLSNTLVLTGLNIYEGLGIDDPEKAKWHDYVFRARGRDLRGAILDFASLPRVDFTGSDLQGARLNTAQLQGASLDGAQLQGASLDGAQLQGASLDGVQLQGASLFGARLQGASLGSARLQGALLNTAQLQGARLDLAQLQGARLNTAQLQGASLDLAQLQGASLAGAHLQGASLYGAGLQGASLDLAHLQGASFDSAQLQGVLLRGAQLQGASLDGAQLQGASLDGVQLQGASLYGAGLQGASLDLAHLQGASFDSAQLQGVLLRGAQLQGASLDSAQLQGASLEQAALTATELSHAYLWRSNRSQPPPTISAIRMSGEHWTPQWNEWSDEDQSWDEPAYKTLQTTINALPAGHSRDAALERIEILDCSSSPPTLASCDPSSDPPLAAVAWRKALEAASVSDDAYREALANILKNLVCSDGEDAIYVLRGISGISRVSTVGKARLEDAGAAATGLIDDLTDKDSKGCPVAAALTDADRAKLLQIKQEIEKAPKPASGRPYSP
jgi:uncharacterized protein YjbI with pentapeptide repeats